MSSQFYNAINYEPKTEKRDAIRKTPTVENFSKAYPFASCRTIKADLSLGISEGTIFRSLLGGRPYTTWTNFKHFLRNFILSYTDDEMSLIWTFQQDNDPKHTSKLPKEWFSQKQIDAMPCPAQSPNLNPIENLSGDISVVAKKSPTSKAQLWQVVQEGWGQTSCKRCEDFVDSMPRYPAIANKGYKTKYWVVIKSILSRLTLFMSHI